MTAETLVYVSRQMLKAAAVVGVILIRLYGLIIMVADADIESVGEGIQQALTSSQAQPVKYYRFPDGLTPIIHTYEYDFWLCQNEAGEYLQCEPTIEVKEAE